MTCDSRHPTGRRNPVLWNMPKAKAYVLVKNENKNTETCAASQVAICCPRTRWSEVQTVPGTSDVQRVLRNLGAFLRYFLVFPPPLEAAPIYVMYSYMCVCMWENLCRICVYVTKLGAFFRYFLVFLPSRESSYMCDKFMYLCVYVFWCVCVCMKYVRVCTYTCICVCMYELCVCVYVYVYMCMMEHHVCMYSGIWVCMYEVCACVCVYVYVCVCVYVCICVWWNTSSWSSSYIGDVFMCVCVYVLRYALEAAPICVMYSYVCVCMYWGMCVCVCIHVCVYEATPVCVWTCGIPERGMSHQWVWYESFMSVTLRILLSQLLYARSHTNGSCHIWMSHVTCEWGMSHMNAAFHGWVRQLLYVRSHMNESCHVWMGYVTYKWVMSHMNEVCCIWMRQVTRATPVCSWRPWHAALISVTWSIHQCDMSLVTYEWGMSHMNAAGHIWMRRVTCATPVCLWRLWHAAFISETRFIHQFDMRHVTYE